MTLTPADQALAARLQRSDQQRPFQAWLDAGCPWPTDRDAPQAEPVIRQLAFDIDPKEHDEHA